MFRWLSLIGMCLFMVFSPVQAQDSDQNTYTVTDAYGETVTITQANLERIITIGGAVTEVVFDLNMGDHIIAVDQSSIYPTSVEDLPQVGYLRFLSAEPILAYNPSLIITTIDAGPPETLDLLESVGIPVLIVPAEDTLEGAEDKIRTIAAGIGKAEEGERLIADMRADIAEAQALTAQVESRPRVLFVFAGSSIALGVLGRSSGGNEMLELVNVENAIDSPDSYIPLTSEGIVASQPDIILTTTLSVERVGGIDKFLALPGISLTPAAQNGRIVYQTLDDLYLLGFTPRLGQAILDLTYLLHEELPRPVSAVIGIDPRLETFESALRLDRQLRPLREGEYTVFAPDDSALAEVTLTDIDTTLYIVAGLYTINDLLTRDSVQAINGETITLTHNGDTITLNGTIHVIAGDNPAANGVLHIIDGVLGGDGA